MTSASLRRATIERIVELPCDTRLFSLRPSDGAPFEFLPGQFLSLQLPSSEPERPLIRPYSIASDPGAPRMDIVLNRVPGGAGSGYLFERKEGDSVDFTGPWGTFVVDDVPAAECIFIAEGTGIAPIRPMLRRILRRGASHPIHLLQVAPTADAMLFRTEFEMTHGLAHKYETIVEGVNAAAGGHQALVDFVDHRWVSGDADRSRHFWICGVGDIVTRLRDLLRGAGYERRAVRYEKW